MVAGLLAIFVAQAWTASRRDSVTIDEFMHLPLGLYVLYTHDLSLDPINPPHTRMFAALPLLLSPPAFSPPPKPVAWGLGYEFMQRNGERYQDLFVRARAMIVVLALVLGVVVATWAAELYGPPAAVCAAFLFSFSPAMLAHGHLVTLDVAGALGFTATAWAVWRLLERPTVRPALITGVVLGAASLLKLSGFVLLAVVLVVIGVRALSERDTPFSRWAALVAVIGVTALFVINAGYGFSGTLAPLQQASLAPGGALARLRDAAPWIRSPLPLSYVNGIDMVMNVGKEHEPSYFLAGELSSEGWWYYHLAAFALKTSLPVLILGFAAAVLALCRRALGRRAYALWVPIVIVFASNSLLNSLQIGVRHVLPVYPLLFVLIGGVAAKVLAGGKRGGVQRALCAAVGVLLAWHAAGTIAVAPRYLQFFNEVAGGAEGGHRWLIDSNIDWGQDLIRLREYMAREHVDAVSLAYFGRVNPGVYGIRFTPLERDSKGIAVVSATFLMGRPYFWFLGGRMRWVPAQTYAWLRDRQPIARVGAMFVYRLD